MRQSVELALAALIIIKPEGWKGTGVLGLRATSHSIIETS
jgi:hypothetical protein